MLEVVGILRASQLGGAPERVTPPPMRFLVLALLAACAHGKQMRVETQASQLTPKEVTVATRGVIEQWRQAYEVRSIDALEQLYSHDPDIVLVNDGVTLIGW